MQTQDSQEVWEKAVMMNIAIYQALLVLQDVIGHPIDKEYDLPGLLEHAKDNLPPDDLYKRLAEGLEPIDPGIGKEEIEQILVRRIEALLVLLWILGEIDQLSDLQVTPISIDELVREYAAIKPYDASKKSSMRSMEAIETARDEAWNWKWRIDLEKEVRSKPIKTASQLEKTLLANIVYRITNELGYFSNAIDGDFPFEGKAFRKIPEIQLREAETRVRVRLYILSWIVGKIPVWDTMMAEYRPLPLDRYGINWIQEISRTPKPYF